MILLMLFYHIDVKGAEVIVNRKYSRVVVISCLSLMLFLNPLSVGTVAKDDKSYRFDEVLSLLSNMHISGMTEEPFLGTRSWNLRIIEHTASASEMFAGFMQDHKLVTLIGTRSFGKGVAQHVTPLISEAL